MQMTGVTTSICSMKQGFFTPMLNDSFRCHDKDAIPFIRRRCNLVQARSFSIDLSCIAGFVKCICLLHIRNRFFPLSGTVQL
jgi:hypothetical protein